jgi:hypothetical protein
VEEDGVAFVNFVDLADEVVHGQTFEHHRAGQRSLEDARRAGRPV